MSKIVKMLQDVYPFGCLGDVVTLAEEEVAKLEKIAKVRKQKLYEDVQAVVDKPDDNAKADAEKQAKADAAAKKAAEDQTGKDAKAKAEADKAAADQAAKDAQAKADAEKAAAAKQ